MKIVSERSKRILIFLIIFFITNVDSNHGYTLPEPGECQDGLLPSGALSLICLPQKGWNGDLVIWAHGYIAYNQPLGFQHLDFNGIYLPELIQKLGFAFATTSYCTNGLAILEGVEDIKELVAIFPEVTGQLPRYIFITGASEGGIITTLLLEQSPELFDGGLACCGPIGDFQKQLNYMGDFRVLFDYFFPGVIPGSPIEIPEEVIVNWDSIYQPLVQEVMLDNPGALAELIKTSRVTINYEDLEEAVASATGLLWYNIFATNDAIEKLKGNPYDNHFRWYLGSDDDQKLNQSIERFKADPQAKKELKRYQTTGKVSLPQVILHTTGDEIVPFWHEILYLEKVKKAGSTKNVIQIPITRYGHCNFTIEEVLRAFALLYLLVTGRELESISEGSFFYLKY